MILLKETWEVSFVIPHSKIVPLNVLPITMTSRTETEKYDSSTMCHSAHVTMHIINVSWIFTKVVISTTTLTKQIKNIWITKSSDKRRFLISQLPTTYEAWRCQICRSYLCPTCIRHHWHAQTVSDWFTWRVYCFILFLFFIGQVETHHGHTRPWTHLLFDNLFW